MNNILLSELGLALFLGASGYALSLSLAPRWKWWQRAFLAYPVGASCYVLLAVLSFALGLLLIPALIGGVQAAAAFAALFQERTSDERPCHVLGLTIMAFFVSVVVIAAVLLNITVLSTDSYHLVFISWGLSEVHLIDLIPELKKFPVYTTVVHGTAYALGAEFSPSFLPLIGASGYLASLMLLIGFLPRTSRRWLTVLAAVLTTCFLFSNYFFVHQQFYLNGHSATAAFLSIALVSVWRSKLTRNAEDWKLIALALTSLCFLRIEGMVLSALVLVLIVSSEEWRRREKLLVCGSTLLAATVWYGKLIAMGASSAFVGPAKVFVMIGLLAVPLVVTATPLLRRFLPFLPHFALLALSTLFLLGAAMYSEHFAVSVARVFSNMVTYGPWSSAWVVVLACLIVGAKSPFPHEGDFSFLIRCFFLMIFVLVFLRHPYNLKWGDSANRMLVHVFPLCVLYLFLKLRFAPVHARADERASASS